MADQPAHRGLIIAVEQAETQADVVLLRQLLVPRRIHRHRPDRRDIGAHLVEVVGDHLVAGDRLAHRRPLGGVGLGGAERLLTQPEGLEPHADARVVHQRQHVGEALAALADELRGGVLEVHRAGRGAVLAELLLDAADRDVTFAAGGRVFVRRHQEHRQPAQARERIGRVSGLLGARDDEVVLAVAGRDEDLLAGQPPHAVVAERGRAAQRRHVAAGVGLGDVHAAPRVAAPDLLDLAGEPRVLDAPVVGVEGGRALADREHHHRQRHAAVKAIVRDNGGVGAGEHLVGHREHEDRAIVAAELARQAHPVQVHLADLGEDVVHHRRRADLAVHQLDTRAIDRAGVRRDLVADELADKLDDVPVEVGRLVDAAEAVGAAEAVLGELDDGRPIEAALHVEAKVLVVLEEVGHQALLSGACDRTRASGEWTQRAGLSLGDGPAERV